MDLNLRDGMPVTPLGPEASPMDFSSTTELGIYSRETTQRHAFGRRIITWDGRVFKYARAAGTLNTDLLAQQNYIQDVGYTTVAASASIGSTEIKLDVGGSDGIAGDGVIAKNALVGGYLILFPHSENSMNRLIVGNTVVASGGGEMVLYLDAPLNIATVVDVTHGECMSSPYAYVKASTTGDANKGFLGLPMTPATVNQFCFLQTWGPCWIAPQTDVGSSASNLQVVARYDGSIQAHDDTDTTYSQMQQHIGFVLSHGSAGAQGAPIIMLQISI